MQAHSKQKKDHTLFGKMLNGGNIPDKARRERTDHDTHQQIANHRWQFQETSHP
jgi:hypothetical protein